MKSRRTAPASEQQLLLPGIDAPPPPLRTRSRATPGERAPRKPPPAHVLFFAIHPGEEDAARIAAWSAQWHAERDLRAMHVEPDRLHVTLHDLGEHDELPHDKVELAIAAASRLHLPRFEVAFDSAMRFAKGLDSHAGIYPHMFQHFCQQFEARFGRPVRWLNFEQDMGIAGFRRSKRSYAPAAMVQKFRARLLR